MSRPTVAALLLSAITFTIACDKVPLLAPTGSTLSLTINTTTVALNGTVEVIATVLESSGTPVHNGTVVTFNSSFGTMEPREAPTQNGQARTTFRAGSLSGTARITAFSGGAAAEEVEVLVGGAAAERISVRAEPQTVLVTGGTATIIAQVTDLNGNPLAGAPTTFQADAGTLSPNSGTTDVNGEVRTTLNTNRDTIVRAIVAGREGQVTVRAVAAPSVSIQVQPSNPIVGQTVSFTIANSGGTNANPITNVTIDFGDGSPTLPLGPMPASGNLIAQKVYTRADTYRVTATLIDNTGRTGTSTVPVTVTRNTPTVSVNVSPSSGNAPLQVTATVTITNSNNIQVSSVNVSWGDNTSTSLGSPQSGTQSIPHTYQNPGQYTVRVTLNDVFGGENTSQTVVSVLGREAIDVDFSHTPQGFLNPTTTFTVTIPGSNSGVSFYTWDFDDGTPPQSTTSRSIDHTYRVGNSYGVRLTVTMVNGNTGSRLKTVVIPAGALQGAKE